MICKFHRSKQFQGVLLDINDINLHWFLHFTTSTFFRFWSPDQTSLQSCGMSEDVTFNWSIFLNFQVKYSVYSIPNPRQLIQSQHLNHYKQICTIPERVCSAQSPSTRWDYQRVHVHILWWHHQSCLVQSLQWPLYGTMLAWRILQIPGEGNEA